MGFSGKPWGGASGRAGAVEGGRIFWEGGVCDLIWDVGCGMCDDGALCIGDIEIAYVLACLAA